jgi:PKD repeat protein
MRQFTGFVLLFVLLLGTNSLFAQIDQGGTPLSFQNETLRDNVDNVFVNPPNMEEERRLHDYLEKNGEAYHVAVPMDVDFDMSSAGSWDILEDGTKVWRLRITSEGAEALSLYYSDFSLPEGSQLFLYNENKSQVAGAFTSDNNQDGGYFSTRIIQGETTTLEYIQPPHVTGTPVLDIYKLSWFYRGVEALVGYYKQDRPPNYGGSGDCEVNVNCPEGNNWQDEKRGVAVIYTPSGGLCTGSLVNNTAEDGTQYFLTADHCGGDQNNQDQWQFYFNFESPDCADPGSAPAYDDVVGATKLARGPINGGTDMLLLEINPDIPADYNVYYNGWDRTDVGATNGIGIHHPAGDIKKISRSGELTVSTYTGSLSDAHWHVVWQSTATDWGVTEGGSSGSPIFDETTKRIVGTLTGGGASCANQSAPDYYGRFDLHWEVNGATDSDQLAPWLDPTGSNAMSVDGYDPNATPTELVADFSANQTAITPGTSISFTDLSDGPDPVQTWAWEFEGATPNTSSDENPSGINYPTAGTYSVTLTVDDGTNTDEEIKTGYIVVSDDPGGLNAAFAPSETNINPGDCINFQDQSTGDPTSWDWTFDGASTPTSTDQNPTNICYDNAGVYDVTLEVSDGTDTDTYTCVGCITVGDPDTEPHAYFAASQTTIPAGGVVTFTDTSVNGPFTTWAWTFEGGLPGTSESEGPISVAYMEPGVYDVELRVEHENGNTYINLKEDYINVVPAANELPEANFIADYTVIVPGETVNFLDISSGSPYQWEWSFESGDPSYSEDQNPQDVLYAAEGEFDVQLIAKNSEGNDTILKEDYIIVSEDDPCLDSMVNPVADFTANQRLISAGDRIFFEDLSYNYPASWNWVFEGGNPSSWGSGTPLSGVEYNVPGIYDVTLSVNNECGNSLLTKDDYIYVFSGPVNRYCDTISNLRGGEIPHKINAPGTWGFIAGHNGERPRYYADYFEDYSFSQIDGLIVPVNNSVYGDYNSYVRFYIWDGTTPYPTDSTILAEKQVYIRNLPENFNSVVEFDNPVEIDGPFYAGFRLNYPDENEDGQPDDYFVVSVAGNRGSAESQNTMYVYDAGEWMSSVELFDIATSLAIKPIACLVDVEQFEMEQNVQAYPNPSTGMVTVKLGEEYLDSDVGIKVFDMTGRQVSLPAKNYGEIEYTLNFTDKPAGMYFINVTIDGRTTTRKVSIMR